MQLHGPYPVMVRDAETGDLTDELAPGEHYTADAALVEAHPELEAYRVNPSPLQNVWSGDEPDNPAWTVPLRFSDADAATAVLGPLGLVAA